MRPNKRRVSARHEMILPHRDGLPIIHIDRQADKREEITLKEAKSAVFKAVLQGHLVIGNEDVLFDAILIFDKHDMQAAFPDFLKEAQS